MAISPTVFPFKKKITPTTNVDAHLLCAHAGADSFSDGWVLYLEACSLFYLHFCPNSNIVIFQRETWNWLFLDNISRHETFILMILGST